MTVLAFYVGFVVLFRSIATISYSLDLKRYGTRNWGWLAALGILGIVFSFILLWNPRFAGMSIVILMALNFFLSGLFGIYLGFEFRSLHKHSKKLSPKLDI